MSSRQWRNDCVVMLVNDHMLMLRRWIEYHDSSTAGLKKRRDDEQQFEEQAAG